MNKAFDDISTAFKDISEFRQKALPTMAQSILEFQEKSKKSEEIIQRMEQGNLDAPKISLELPE